MLNKIWFGLLCIGLLYGFAKASYQSIQLKTNAVKTSTEAQPAKESTQTPPPHPASTPPAASGTAAANKSLEPGLTAMGKRLNGALLDGAQTAVEICIGLIGIMALWLGLLNVAKDAGLIDALARVMNPFMRWLFPEVPNGHPAQGAMLMSFSANMFGLDNAATPMGLKAMEELQKLNPVKDTATNSMALFLAINCGSITLIPFTIIGYRAIKGSQNPAEIIAGTLLASLASVVAGVTVARWLGRSPRYAVAAEAPSPESEIEARDGGSPR